MALVAVRSDRAAPEELPICLAKLVQVTYRVTRCAVLVRSGIEHSPELEDLSPGLRVRGALCAVARPCLRRSAACMGSSDPASWAKSETWRGVSSAE